MNRYGFVKADFSGTRPLFVELNNDRCVFYMFLMPVDSYMVTHPSIRNNHHKSNRNFRLHFPAGGVFSV